MCSCASSLKSAAGVLNVFLCQFTQECSWCIECVLVPGHSRVQLVLWMCSCASSLKSAVGVLNVFSCQFTQECSWCFECVLVPVHSRVQLMFWMCSCASSLKSNCAWNTVFISCWWCVNISVFIVINTCRFIMGYFSTISQQTYFWITSSRSSNTVVRGVLCVLFLFTDCIVWTSLYTRAS